MGAQMLEGYSSLEKTAYVTAIASIATADKSASDQEITYLGHLAEAAGLSENEKQQVAAAASETSGQPLKNALDVLKSSELRYSLVTDLIAFAKSDNNVVDQEKTHIASIANYLQINDDQLEALNHYVEETATQPAALGIAGAGASSGGLGGIIDNLGLGQKLQNSGINIGSLAKGLIGFIGPMIMGNMLNKGMQGTNASSGLNQGGLGSLIGSLTGGAGNAGIGGFLSNLLK
ncbi:MAG: TerB family tellurite resistance protein [Flavitalea sp.]